jgi:hypothetical protein
LEVDVFGVVVFSVGSGGGFGIDAVCEPECGVADVLDSDVVVVFGTITLVVLVLGTGFFFIGSRVGLEGVLGGLDS